MWEYFLQMSPLGQLGVISIVGPIAGFAFLPILGLIVMLIPGLHKIIDKWIP